MAGSYWNAAAEILVSALFFLNDIVSHYFWYFSPIFVPSETPITYRLFVCSFNSLLASKPWAYSTLQITNPLVHLESFKLPESVSNDKNGFKLSLGNSK